MARLPLNPASRYESSRGQLRRFGWLSCVLVVALPALAIVVVPPLSARAATPEKLVGRPGAGEFQPVRGDNFIAWQQNTRRNPNDYDVFARGQGGAPSVSTRAGCTPRMVISTVTFSSTSSFEAATPS